MLTQEEKAALEQRGILLRRHILELVRAAKAGHIGGDMSVVDILHILYFREMRVSPTQSGDPLRDRMILSKGHCMEAYYVVLCERGFLDYQDVLQGIGTFGTPYIGHPNCHLNGVEVNSGSLGHGLPVGVGMALAAKMDESPSRTYVVTGDGEWEEGSNWEAAMAAAQYGLDNLCLVIDRNRLQISGTTEQVMAHENMAERLSSFGWHTVTCRGNDYESLAAAFDEARGTRGRPTAILAQTVKGCGISFMEDQVGWHHRVPTEDEYQQAMQELEVKAHGFCQ